MRVHVALVLSALIAPAELRAQASRPVAPPLRVPRGMVLEATMQWFRGSVEVAAPGQGTHPATAGEVLTRGARVVVGEGAAAEVRLANGTTLELNERSSMMMFASPQPSPPDQPPSITTTLQRGVLRIRMGEQQAAHPAMLMPVGTASTTVFVGRSDAMLAADLGGHITRIATHRGRIRVRANTREYILRAGQGVTEEFGRPPTPIRTLPAAPAWLATPPARIISGGEPVEVSVAYGLRGNAAPAAWRLQVARDADFHDLVVNERRPADARRWESAQLTAGPWYARVMALDAERFEGPASPTAYVFVAAPRVVPGRLAEGATPGRVATVEVPDGFRCGLDGAPPRAVEAPIPLVPGREHALFCLSDTGRFDLRGISVTAAQSGPLVREVSLRGVSWGESVLGLRLRDAEGHGVPYADVTVTNDQGVTVDPVREASERGVYNAAIHWPRGVNRARFRFTINGAESFEQDLAQGD